MADDATAEDHRSAITEALQPDLPMYALKRSDRLTQYVDQPVCAHTHRASHCQRPLGSVVVGE